MNWSSETFFAYIGDPLFVNAAIVTIWVAVVSQIIGVVVGFGVALMQLSQNPALRWAANVHVWFWRGSPLLVQLFLLYFGLPQLGIRFNVIEAGLIGLGPECIRIHGRNHSRCDPLGRPGRNRSRPIARHQPG